MTDVTAEYFQTKSLESIADSLKQIVELMKHREVANS